ncbi:MAG: S41 family peptidase [Vicinamibacterales bacterium]|nr:S41 family peptidase [Vicinamibacterales bacterium]
MRSRGRLAVLLVSLPVITYAVVGGFMGKAIAREDSYQSLRIFEDVVTLIMNSYVEDVKVDEVMHGAMHGLADGLDPDSAYLTAEQVAAFERRDQNGPADVGLELTRQYYLRVIAARDGSPAALAGLRAGDYIRAIDGQSTRDTSVVAGQQLLRGKAGTPVRLTVLRGNAAEPHAVELTREARPALPARGRLAANLTGYVRIAEFDRQTASQVKAEVGKLTTAGATRLVLDVRGTAFGDVEAGLDTARLFVPDGVLTYRQDRGKEKEAVSAARADGALTLPLAVLVDFGTSGPAEVLAAALAGNDRAMLVGERTLGRAARQKLVRLPDGSGLILTHLLYLTPGSEAIHEKGLTPAVVVERAEVEFGQQPSGDPALDKAIESLGAAARPAA